MSERQQPPPGPPSRDPTAAARLLAAASDVGLRVERARNELEWLAHTAGELAGAAGVPPDAPRNPRSPEHQRPAGSSEARARQLAIDLAVGGTPREVIDRELQRRFAPSRTSPVVRPSRRASPDAGDAGAESDSEEDLARP